MHLLSPLRSKWRSMAVAMLAAVMLVVLTAGSVLATGHTVANDGQTLADQSPEIQALYTNVHGDNAAAQWVIDHNAAIGGAPPQEAPPVTDSADYLRVRHVAYQRSGDLDTADRIAANVISRGTVEAFLAGNDPGVIYGVVPPPAPPKPAPPPAPPPAPKKSTPKKSAPAPEAMPMPEDMPEDMPDVPTPTVGVGLFEGLSVASFTYIVGVATTLDIDPDMPGEQTALPEAKIKANVGSVDVAGARTYAYVYKVTGLPNALAFDDAPSARTLTRDSSNVPDASVIQGPHTVTYTVTETETRYFLTGEGVEVDSAESESHASLMFTITVVADLTPSFGSQMVDDIAVVVDHEDHESTLPPAMSGSAPLTYSLSSDGTDVNDADGVAGVTFDADSRKLTVSDDAALNSTNLVYTVTDADDDAVTLEFDVTVEADVSPTLNAISDISATAGTDLSEVLAVGTGGNGTLTYAIHSMPDWLEFDSDTRTISGMPDEEGRVSFVYRVTDVDGDKFEITVYINVAASN